MLAIIVIYLKFDWFYNYISGFIIMNVYKCMKTTKMMYVMVCGCVKRFMVIFYENWYVDVIFTLSILKVNKALEMVYIFGEIFEKVF